VDVAVHAGLVLSCFALAAALYEAFVNRAWASARLLALTGATGFVLSWLTGRRSRVAAVGLAALFSLAGGVYAWAALPHMQVGAFVAFTLLALFRGLAVFRLPTLYAEFRQTWTPRDVTAGDVYTVRDAAAYGVVKVLAVEPERIHVRQYGLRYSERPWQVKSSTLERHHDHVPAPGFPHLPLDRSEFIRWEPVFLRQEPLRPSEVAALDAWRRVQGMPATPPAG